MAKEVVDLSKQNYKHDYNCNYEYDFNYDYNYKYNKIPKLMRMNIIIKANIHIQDLLILHHT